MESSLSSSTVVEGTRPSTAGTAPTSVCSMINLLNKEDTSISTDPGFDGEVPGKGPFTIQPTNAKPKPEITVTPADPTTVMGVSITGNNLKSVTVVFKNGNGDVVDTVLLTGIPGVSQFSFFFQKSLFDYFENKLKDKFCRCIIR